VISSSVRYDNKCVIRRSFKPNKKNTSLLKIKSTNKFYTNCKYLEDLIGKN
jgi:hypothetical protein